MTTPTGVPTNYTPAGVGVGAGLLLGLKLGGPIGALFGASIGGAIGYFFGGQIVTAVKPFAQPPSVGGYTAPPAPPTVPPSWVYQGPVIPATPPTPSAKTIPVTLAPGVQHITPNRGDNLIVTLPAGAKWAPGNSADPSLDPTLVPTSLGGSTDSDYTVGPTAPFKFSGMQGAATISFVWIDKSGKMQTMLLDVAVPGAVTM